MKCMRRDNQIKRKFRQTVMNLNLNIHVTSETMKEKFQKVKFVLIIRASNLDGLLLWVLMAIVGVPQSSIIAPYY